MTDGRTHGDSILRASIASRGKNLKYDLYNIFIRHEGSTEQITLNKNDKLEPIR